MIGKINHNRGQIALVLILLTAAVLIFLSITLNWGRIAQTKTMLSIAADQAAAMLASDAASYGEMEKQTNLQDTNQVSALSGVLMDIIMVVIAIIILLIACYTYGAGLLLFGVVMAALSVVMAIVTLILELTVIQPGMEALWNKLQLSQPVQQQFFEGGVGQALQGSVTDQVNITDYFDSNANGMFGVSGTTAKDTVSRFGLFYTDRLKMLNQGVIPQVAFFYNQLTEFIDGQTCAQNYTDSGSPTSNSGNTIAPSNTGVPLNPACLDPATGLDYCYVPDSPGTISNDPACTQKISNLITCAQNAYDNSIDASIALNPECPGPNNPVDKNSCSGSNPTDPSCQRLVSNPFSFQLNDSCTDSAYYPGSTTYNPYCDQCCQPWAVSTSGAKAFKQTYKVLRPSTCPDSGSTPPSDCVEGGLNSNIQDAACFPAQCSTSPNNPYTSYGSYPYLYDASYQEYANGISFLDQYGRDEQAPDNPAGLPTPGGFGMPAQVSDPFKNILDPQGNFPNGIYPFFYLMSDYSPQVDNLPDPTTLQPSQYHWCATVPVGKSYTPPTGYTDLIQLGQAPYTLSYSCTGPSCCVQYLMDSLTASPAGASTSNVLTITIGSAPTVSLSSPANGATFSVGGSITISGTAFEASPGSIASISVAMTPTSQGPSTKTLDTTDFTYTPSLPAGGTNITFNNNSNPVVIAPCFDSKVVSGSYLITATATDASGVPVQSSVTITINNPGACSATNCGTDVCTNACPTTCGGSTPICCATATCSSNSQNITTGLGTCVACTPTTSCSGMDCGIDSCGNSCQPETCTTQGQTCNTGLAPYSC